MEGAPSQGVGRRPAVHGQVVEVTQQVLRPRRTEMPAQRESSQCGDNFDVDQGWSVQVMEGGLGPQLVGAGQAGERIDHRKATNRSLPWGRDTRITRPKSTKSLVAGLHRIRTPPK